MEKEKILENFVNVIARCVLRSGTLEVCSKRVHQCSPDILDEKAVCMAACQIDVEPQHQRTMHDDFISVQLGNVDVKRLAWVCLTGGKTDALHSALGLSSPRGLFRCALVEESFESQPFCLSLRIYTKMGDTETDPVIPAEERPDDNDGDTTQSFQPVDASTPGPSCESYPITTRNSLPEHDEGTSETSYIEPRSGPVITHDSVKKLREMKLLHRNTLNMANMAHSLPLTFQKGENFQKRKTCGYWP